VADILNYYLDVRAINWRKTDRYPKPIARPTELANRCEKLLEFWGEKTAEEIDHDTIDDFVDECESTASARRQLEDLRAACNLAFDRKKLTRQIRFELPAKSDARSEYLDRSEVAKLLWTAWKKRGLNFSDGKQNPDAYIWRHLIPFILTAVYTGTRKTRIYNASFERMPGRPFVDLKKGIYYRLATNEVPYSNKQAPTIMLPGRLLAHMRRWQRMGRKFLVEYQGRAVNPTKALRALIKEALGRDDIVIHSFRHTAATWLMEDTTLPLKDISEYLGMSMEMLQRYGQSRLGHQSAIGRSLSSSTGRAATVAR
jgi:integrase